MQNVALEKLFLRYDIFTIKLLLIISSQFSPTMDYLNEIIKRSKNGAFRAIYSIQLLE